MLSFVVFNIPARLGGVCLADWSLAHRDLTIETTQRGYGTCTAVIVMPPAQARHWFGILDGMYVVVSESWGLVYEGRIEVTETADDELHLTAFGYSRAYSDVSLSALWSTMQYANWQPVSSQNISNRNDTRWTLDTNNRLYLAPNGGEAHDTSNGGSQTFVIPSGSNRQLVAITFDYSFTALNGTWVAALDRFTDTYGYQSTTWTLYGNGATQTGTQNLTLAACDRLLFNVYFNRAPTTLGTAILAVDTSYNGPIAIGLQRIQPAAMTNIVVGMWLDVDDDAINTSIAAAITVTGSQAVTPASMIFIVVGSQLIIDQRNSETVIVSAVTATTFTATFAKTHLANSTVKRSGANAQTVQVLAIDATGYTAEYLTAQAFGSSVKRALLREVMPASMAGIVTGGLLAIGGTTPEQVEVLDVTATTFTAEFSALHATSDPVSVVWEGETGAINLTITNLRVKTTTSATLTSDEVVRALIATVKATNPNHANSTNVLAKSPGFDLKEYAYDGVTAADVLDELAALGGDGWLWSWRVWHDQLLVFDRIASTSRTYQIYDSATISRDVETLTTRLIPRYTDANGVLQTGAAVINTQAELRYALVRTRYFDVPTTSASDATTLTQAALNDRSIINAYGDVEVRELFQNGQRVPLTQVRSGDTIQCLQFPTTGNSETDKTRTFRIAATSYNHESRTLTISPEQRAPTIDSLLARREIQGKNR